MVEKVFREPRGRCRRYAAYVFDSLPWGGIPQAERPCNLGAGPSACLQAVRTGPSSNAFIPTGRGVGRPAPGHAQIAPVLAMTSAQHVDGHQGGTVMPRTAAPTQLSDWQSRPTLREPRYSQLLKRGHALPGCFRRETQVLGIATPTAADLPGRWSAHRSDQQPRWHRD